MRCLGRVLWPFFFLLGSVVFILLVAVAVAVVVFSFSVIEKMFFIRSTQMTPTTHLLLEKVPQKRILAEVLSDTPTPHKTSVCV
jgi:hypothetical protein